MLRSPQSLDWLQQSLNQRCHVRIVEKRAISTSHWVTWHDKRGEENRRHRQYPFQTTGELWGRKATCNPQTGSSLEPQVWNALWGWLFTPKVAIQQKMHLQEPAKHQPGSDSEWKIQPSESSALLPSFPEEFPIYSSFPVRSVMAEQHRKCHADRIERGRIKVLLRACVAHSIYLYFTGVEGEKPSWFINLVCFSSVIFQVNHHIELIVFSNLKSLNMKKNVLFHSLSYHVHHEHTTTLFH